jgi:hypothetical protein
MIILHFTFVSWLLNAVEVQLRPMFAVAVVTLSSRTGLREKHVSRIALRDDVSVSRRCNSLEG